MSTTNCNRIYQYSPTDLTGIDTEYRPNETFAYKNVFFHFKQPLYNMQNSLI